MKKITAREFARNQARIVGALKPHESLAVTKHGRTMFVISKPENVKRRRVRAADLLKDLEKLPMTEAEGDEILRKFASVAIF